MWVKWFKKGMVYIGFYFEGIVYYDGGSYGGREYRKLVILCM